jgi:ABC-type nitrate/sulfonate/bicarbonate transport system permease component
MGMKFLKLYLVGYFVLLAGAGLALWQAGVLDDIPLIWLAIGVIVAVGLGLMLAVASSPRAVTTTTTRDV